MFPILVRLLGAVGSGGAIALVSIPWVAIAPVTAQTAQINLSVAPQAQESYAHLVQRSEKLVEQSLNAHFKAKNSPSSLKLLVVGENNGQVAPVLSIAVSRQGWFSQPITSRWATYYPDSQLLLGFTSPPTPSPSDNAPPPPASPSQPGVSPTTPNAVANPPNNGQSPTTAPPKPETPPLFNPDPREIPPEPPRVEDRLRTPARMEEGQKDDPGG